jgi:hypothetical protein
VSSHTGIGRRISLATRGWRGGIFDKYYSAQDIEITTAGAYSAVVTANPTNIEASVTVKSDTPTGYSIDSILIDSLEVQVIVPNYKVELTILGSDANITILDGVPDP